MCCVDRLSWKINANRHMFSAMTVFRELTTIIPFCLRRDSKWSIHNTSKTNTDEIISRRCSGFLLNTQTLISRSFDRIIWYGRKEQTQVSEGQTVSMGFGPDEYNIFNVTATAEFALVIIIKY